METVFLIVIVLITIWNVYLSFEIHKIEEELVLKRAYIKACENKIRSLREDLLEKESEKAVEFSKLNDIIKEKDKEILKLKDELKIKTANKILNSMEKPEESKPKTKAKTTKTTKTTKTKKEKAIENKIINEITEKIENKRKRAMRARIKEDIKEIVESEKKKNKKEN